MGLESMNLTALTEFMAQKEEVNEEDDENDEDDDNDDDDEKQWGKKGPSTDVAQLGPVVRSVKFGEGRVGERDFCLFYAKK